MIDLKKYIVNVPDFPTPGISFKDITPLLNDVEAFHYVIEEFSQLVKQLKPTVILSPEARGFLFGPAVSFNSKVGFVPVRKPGKLPRTVVRKNYSLEYGENMLEMHLDAIKPNDRVLIIDDVLATGGTVKAICDLVEEQGATVVGLGFLINLTSLPKDPGLLKYSTISLVEY
ncbi:adenine phosphoribosyltransferase [Spiroplasma chrysopicola]|uniref:Adenine phosphoribosyltransferase n=1 Tax=Spiroplasma chrysopicola DF-1 TaxID=1276227 RepID=R4U1B4_9MOLU|nr:adenine phosphoribosyltransferase [Spiroplasma chrysopicola]AGM25122.1 adenine phosphoribosyltransferase [Spiroplasma chrysopicola DF-1]